MILGVDVYAKLILEGLIKAHDKSYIVQETEIGWIVSGPIKKQSTTSALCMVANVNDIDMNLQRFWELEEINGENSSTSDESKFMEYFNTTVRRDDSGVYVVSLPFRDDAKTLGNSRRMAMAQFFQLERKFKREPQLKTAYAEYINELIVRGYMKLSHHVENEQHYYLPQHPVFKDSSTTKVRPVFNGSQKTSNGQSLNDILITGPKLQDLFDIMLRFRKHEIAFTADIEKMYLHVKLDEKDHKFQKIFWRENENDLLHEYCLTTVTFGINSSPSMAVATVQHHAKQRMHQYPHACKIISKDSYMDDISSGCDTVDEAINLREEISHVLAEADFPLRKWASNSHELLETIPEDQKEKTKLLGIHKYVTILGHRWFCEIDKIGFKYNTLPIENLTKRNILSKITQIYDPLGLLSPITVFNKIMMQQIWRENIGWDEKVSENTAKKWMAFMKEAPIIEQFKVQRWLNNIPGGKIELHGFGDASEDAMCAMVYMKTVIGGDVYVELAAAKTKVAPTNRITIPKLELCAAVLLVKLMRAVKRALQLEKVKTYYYSDSEITLAWIKGDPTRWKTFVANRVAKIHEYSDANSWRYINTKANPADFGSRGLLPSQLLGNKLWWEGPSILLNDNEVDCIGISEFKTQLEEKRPKQTVMHAEICLDLVHRFSNLNRALRAIAYCKRYVNSLKKKHGLKSVMNSSELKEKKKNYI